MGRDVSFFMILCLLTKHSWKGIMVLLESNIKLIQRKVILEAVYWIEADLSKFMNTEIVASQCGYSQYHFQRLFRDLTGYTLAAYIRARRMTVAARLLRENNLPVSDIYVQVGFYEASTFCRVFRRYFGLSPTTFRASYLDFSGFYVEWPDQLPRLDTTFS